MKGYKFIQSDMKSKNGDQNYTSAFEFWKVVVSNTQPAGNVTGTFVQICLYKKLLYNNPSLFIQQGGCL